MNIVSEPLKELIQNYSRQNLQAFLRSKNRQFAPRDEVLSGYDTERFSEFHQVGAIDFGEKQNWDRLIAVSIYVGSEISERSCRKAQFETARKILKNERVDAGLFAFHDAEGSFRLSLVYTIYEGGRLRFNHFRRFTYFVRPNAANKTLVQQLDTAKFDSICAIQKAFSIEAVSESFYNDFKPRFDALAASVKGEVSPTDKEAEDFALLLVIRTVFLGFIQKRGWLGDNQEFLQTFRNEFEERGNHGTFYSRWLAPLFFQALSTPPGSQVAYQNNEFSPETQKKLLMAPFLNGGLFQKKRHYDDRDWWFPDEAVFGFFDFLFQYNFTIEENELYDEDLELNPEFLGLIFERLVNKADGAVYTPREEVDFMCRLSLVKWLEKNNETDCPVRDLYELFFREVREGEADEEDQRYGSFSRRQIRDLLEKLGNITICDPAVGSGAFAVAMMHVLDEVETILHKQFGEEITQTPFERKQRIIQNTIYGVEVKEWAVWICQLRLWVSLFIEADDQSRYSQNALLPSLDFKVRKGDSLIQTVGSKLFPVEEHAAISTKLKRQVTELKKAKVDFFQNKYDRNGYQRIHKMEQTLFRNILECQIDHLRQEICKIQGDGKVQPDLLGGKTESFVDTKKIAEIENEIENLEQQRKALRDEHPLIWNIEFAEIFSEHGGFDLVIGNPPYVRSEKISDPLERMTSGEYKDKLSEMVELDFPKAFGKKDKISKKSDLYTYFYIRGLHLLNKGGLHTFICSNSWLDAGYGTWLQKFFIENCHIQFIIDNHARRSFANADVNTIVSVIGAPVSQSQKKKLGTNPARFVAFKKPFEETVFTENLLQINSAKEIVKNDDFRVFPVAQYELEEKGAEYEKDETDEKDQQEFNQSSVSKKYIGDKWGGKYLRAPDIYYKILSKNLMQLSPLAYSCSFGGYIHDNATGAPYPEVNFLRSIKDVDCIWLDNETKGVVPFGVKSTDANRTRADLLVPRTLRDRHLILLNKGNVFGKEFYKIITKKVTALHVAVWLNSTFGILQREVSGIAMGGGGGPLKFKKDDIKTFMLLLGPVPAHLKNSSFWRRPQHGVLDECGIDPESDIPMEGQEPDPLPDRKELDDFIFDELELTEEERKDVYRAVCLLVWNRISKARSV